MAESLSKADANDLRAHLGDAHRTLDTPGMRTAPMTVRGLVDGIKRLRRLVESLQRRENRARYLLENAEADGMPISARDLREALDG